MAGKISRGMAALGAYSKFWAALGTGGITYLMIAYPGRLWAEGAALGINAVLVYLVPNYRPPAQLPPGGQPPAA